MAKHADLDRFMADILNIEPRYGDISENGIPAMGMPNMGADIATDLRKKATVFGRAYTSSISSTADVQQLADATEGSLMAAVTIGIVKSAEADFLVDALYQLVDTYQPH